MSTVDIPPKSNDPTEPVEWNQRAQDFFVSTVTEVQQPSESDPTLSEAPDLASDTAGQSPERTQKTLQQGALDRIFTWWKDANNTERTVAVVAGAAIIALGAYVIKKAIDGVVRLGSWVVEKLTGYRNETIENIVKVGLGIGVAKAFYDVVTSEEVVTAFVANGWKGVGELFLTKVLENAIDLGAIGEDRWNALREKIPQLPEYAKVEELINARGDAVEKARAAMQEMRERLEAEGQDTNQSLWDRIVGVAPILGGAGNNDNDPADSSSPAPTESTDPEPSPIEYDKERYISVEDLKGQLKTQLMDSTLDIKRDAQNNPEIAGSVYVYTPLDTAALKTADGCITALRWLLPANLTQAGTRLGLIMSLYVFLDAADERYDDELIPKNEEDYEDWVNGHEMFAENEALRQQMLEEKELVLGIANNDLNVWNVLSDELKDAGYKIDEVTDLLLEAINPTGETKVVRINRRCVANLRDIIRTVQRNKYPQYRAEFQEVNKLIQEIEDGLVVGNMHVSQDQIRIIEEAINNLSQLDGVEIGIEFEVVNDRVVSYQINAPGAGSVSDYKGNLSLESSLSLSESLVVADYLHPDAEGDIEWGVIFRNAKEATLDQIDAAKNLRVDVIVYNHFAYIIEGTKAFIVGGADFVTSIGVEDGQITLNDDFVVEEYLAPYGKGLAVVAVWRSVQSIATRRPWSIPGRLLRSVVYPAEAVLSVTKLKDKALRAKYRVLQFLAEGRSLSQTAQNRANLYKAIAELYDSQASFLKRATPWYSNRFKRLKIQELDSLLKGILDDDTYNRVFRLLKESGMDYRVVRDEVLPILKNSLSELGENVDEILDDVRPPGSAVSEADEVLERAAGESDEVLERAAAEGEEVLERAGAESDEVLVERAAGEADEAVERATGELDEALERGMKEAADDLDLGEKQMAELFDELNKPHWRRALVGSAEVLGHSVAPAFIVYMAYDMRFGDTAHDPQNTVATHIGFIAAFKLGAEGVKRGGTVKQKILLGLAGALTPLLAAFGVQIESVENWVNEYLVAGDFSKAFWNQSEDALGVAEFYLANRLFFTGAIGRALGSKVDLAVRPLMGLALRSKIVSSIRNIFLKEGVKKLATKMGIVLATRGASATAVNAVPVAGQVASVALWLWTAWEVGNIGYMYYKAKQTEDLFESQEAKDVANVTVDEVGERSLHDEFEAFKQGTPFESYEYATLPPDIKMNFMLERYQELPDVHITIHRTDGSSETSHWTNGTVRYVKVIADGETIELTEEDLNTEAPETLPPVEYLPVDIPYAELEAAAEEGGEALITDYYNLEISTLRERTEWSKLNPTVVDSKKIIIQRTGMDFDSLVMERDGSTWKIKSEKKEFEFGGNYSFHNALAYAGLVLHSIGFLYDEVHVKKHSRWRSEDGTLDPFYLNGDKEIVYSKDEYIFDIDRAVYGRDWLDFYVNNLKLRRESMVSGLNQYFRLHAEELDLIGD